VNKRDLTINNITTEEQLTMLSAGFAALYVNPVLCGDNDTCKHSMASVEWKFSMKNNSRSTINI